MNILKRTLITLYICSLTTETFSAVERAQAFSRANCRHPLAFNESISYDLTTGVHRDMKVVTRQISDCGKYRELESFNKAGFRVRAGFIDSFDSTNWTVDGIHEELLDNGTIARATSTAKTCNLQWDQWL